MFGPLSVVYQYKFIQINYHTPFGTLTTHNRDRAAGVVYAMSPNVHLKLERHRADGYKFDHFSPPTGTPRRTNYTIGSLSVSF